MTATTSISRGSECRTTALRHSPGLPRGWSACSDELNLWLAGTERVAGAEEGDTWDAVCVSG